MVKMDMTAVADEHRVRTQRIVQASANLAYLDLDVYAESLALALFELAEMWREDARKAMEENKRGCKGTADSLRDCATRVAGVAIAIRQHGLPRPKDDAPAPPLSTESSIDQSVSSSAVEPEPIFSIKNRPDLAQAFLADVGSDKATELYAYAKLGDETLAEAASNIIEQVIEKRAAEAIDPGQVKVIKHARIESVSLVSNPLPGMELTVVEPLSPDRMQEITSAAGFGPPPAETIEVSYVPYTVTTADAPPSWTLQPEVPVFELTDDPATWMPAPAHAGVSQVQLMAECGLKYWLRYRRGAPERPSWAMIGGSALHACIETIELSDMNWDDSIPQLWTARFQAIITETIISNPLWPESTWHASKGGKEDRAWWDSDGPEMVHRYLEWRARWIAQGWELIKDAQGPLIEREFLTFIGGKPVKGFVDQAWYHPQRELVAILDAKSGASAPPDYFQLAVYAQALRTVGRHAATWVGGYWDARKGELMAPGLVELEKRHTFGEIEMRFTTFNAMNNANLYPPNTNTAFGGCNSCSLKRSCPIGSRMNAGTINTVG